MVLDPKRSDVAIKQLQKSLNRTNLNVSFDELTEEQKKQLKGDNGDSYVLTNQDKLDIAGLISAGDSGTVSKFTSEWLSDTNVYPYGTILIYSDYITIGNANGTTETVPAFKVGDGTHKASELPFTSAENIKKLGHSITIGTYIFDGSQDIVIPVYTGESEVS